MKKVNQGAQKFQRLLDNYELTTASKSLAEKVFKQKDQVKSEMWQDELRRALARVQMTLQVTDEFVAPLSLPWYAGRKDEFGRLEVESAPPVPRWRGRPNFADPAYWARYWDEFFEIHGYFTRHYEDVNCKFMDVWPMIETFLQAKVDAEKERLSKLAIEADAALSHAKEEEAVHVAAMAISASGAFMHAPHHHHHHHNDHNKAPGHEAAENKPHEEHHEKGKHHHHHHHHGNKKDAAEGDDHSLGHSSGHSSGKSALHALHHHKSHPVGGGKAAAAAITAAKARAAAELAERPQHKSALILGVGMSTAPMDLYEQGFKRIVCIDVSSRVILNLTERYKEFPGIEVIECDARNLDRFPTASFELVFEKGLIDVLYSGWVGFKDIDLICEAVCRVLAPGGVFVSVSYAPPGLRAAHFEESSTPDTVNRFHPWDLLSTKGPDGKGDAGGLWVYTMSRLAAGQVKENEVNEKGHGSNELQATEDGHDSMSMKSGEVLERKQPLQKLRSRKDTKVGVGDDSVDSNHGSNATVDAESAVEDDDEKPAAKGHGLGKPPVIDQGPTLEQRAYHLNEKSLEATGRKPKGFVKLMRVRDPAVLLVNSRAPRAEARPSTPSLEEYLKSGMTQEEAWAAQEERKAAIKAGVIAGEAAPLIASEVGYEIKLDSLRRAAADTAAIQGGTAAGSGYKSEAFSVAKAKAAENERRKFSLEPVQELARSTVKGFLSAAGDDLEGWEDVPAAKPQSGEGSTDVNDLIHELVKGQRELTRLRMERPPQALEPKGDERPISIHEYEVAEREKKIRELKAARAKLGLDENDITRPPEKWTEAMRSFVDYVPYGPPPPEEQKWEALTDMVQLTAICERVVNDAAVARQLQQWTDGKSKVYKVFLARALEATEDKAPVQLLRQALNSVLGEFREVDQELLILAMGSEDAAKARSGNARTKRAPKSGAGEDGGGAQGSSGTGDASKGKSRAAGKNSRRQRNGSGSQNGEENENTFGEGSKMRNMRILEEKVSKGKPLNVEDDEFD